jgi:hypothetical protein
MSIPAVDTIDEASPEHKLQQTADSASRMRALSTSPAIVALRVEAVQKQVDCLMWLGILLGLAFTMANVQAFAANGATPWSLAWLTAWLLDPMVSVVLIAVLLAEQVFSQYQVIVATPWIQRTKVFTFAATFVMNVWEPAIRADVAGLVLHSVPPVLVYCAAETAPHLRDRLTEAVNQAERAAVRRHDKPSYTRSDPPAVSREGGDEPSLRTPTEAAGSSTPAAAEPSRRKLLADFVADARAAWRPGIDVTPQWVREVTGCSAGLSRKVIDALGDLTSSKRPVREHLIDDDSPNKTTSEH